MAALPDSPQPGTAAGTNVSPTAKKHAAWSAVIASADTISPAIRPLKNRIGSKSDLAPT